ncbi:hypothetical protein I79_014869 [Cricetulus griseus]|uniref:Uncharacterized protein n=1 Tax=Cricetulus griseus TaxID=10029 RepID=G3HV91_CRIGR|nr:hypothetical protein I79_014869 [Cricetulus griseus]
MTSGKLAVLSKCNCCTEKSTILIPLMLELLYFQLYYLVSLLWNKYTLKLYKMPKSNSCAKYNCSRETLQSNKNYAVLTCLWPCNCISICTTIP